MQKVGIVGHEAAKFTPVTEAEARRIIRELLADPAAVCVSGECHLGGVDIYAKQEARVMCRDYQGYPPRTHNWGDGYKPRNMHIAEASDIVHVIVVASYPPSYGGMRFDYCYHCKTSEHIKSGGCWTAKYAERLGKPARWHVVSGVASPTREETARE